MIKIFDSCIAPIPLHGSEIWEACINHDWKKWDCTSIEKIHTQFLKRILGVNRFTTNMMVRGELGRHQILQIIFVRNLIYLKYLIINDRCFCTLSKWFTWWHNAVKSSLYKLDLFEIYALFFRLWNISIRLKTSSVPKALISI